MLIIAMSKSEVVALAPRPNKAIPRQGQRELSSTFNLTNPNSIELFHILWHAATLTSTPAQFAKVSITPSVDEAFIC
jgi:hypothetical protein